jgi:hypothetical protein
MARWSFFNTFSMARYTLHDGESWSKKTWFGIEEGTAELGYQFLESEASICRNESSCAIDSGASMPLI